MAPPSTPALPVSTTRQPDSLPQPFSCEINDSGAPVIYTDQADAVLRYSATHKTTHNKIHRLDALDAYNQKLVKKIAVRGISVKGLAGTAGYLYLQSIEISSKKPPEARVEFEQKLAVGNIKRVVRKLSKGDNLFDLSNGLDQYRDGFVVSDMNANVTGNVKMTP